MKQRLLTLLLIFLSTISVAWAQRNRGLTLEAIEDGTITFSYVISKNMLCFVNGTKYPIAVRTENAPAVTEIPVQAGDKVMFFASEQIPRHYYTYKKADNTYAGIYTTISCTGDCYIYGNIMSLLYPSTSYATASTLDTNTSQTLFNTFKNNTHLKNHPENDLVLPATTLAQDCYRGLFYGCSGLTRAPKLPAMTLKTGCYQSMFTGCTGLTESPELPATILPENCYNYMFANCENLCYVTSAATNVTAANCTKDWLKGVAAEGTIVVTADAAYSEGDSGIPSGWTVQYMPQPFAVYDSENTTLTFYYKDASEMPAENAWGVAGTSTTSNPGLWQQYAKEITKVVFDPSFIDARPQSCAYWFYNMENLTDENLIGLEYLNTSKCSSFKYMFAGCKGLRYLDLRNQTSSQVTDMSYMFSSTGLIIVDVSSFTTGKVTQMTWMFSSPNLQGIIATVNSNGQWSLGNLDEKQTIFDCGPIGDINMPSETSYRNKYAATTAYYFIAPTREINTLGQDTQGYYWSSWYRGGTPRQVDDNTIVYTARRDGDKVLITELNTKIIPPNKAVILRSTEKKITLTALCMDAPTDEYSTNELTGFNKPTFYNADYQAYYKLALDSEDGFVFEKAPSGNTSKFIAYFCEYDGDGTKPAKLLLNFDCLHVGGNPVREGLFEVVYCTKCGAELSRESIATGITTTECSHDSHAPYYDLQGRRVITPTKGLYIKDGKKVVVK